MLMGIRRLALVFDALVSVAAKAIVGAFLNRRENPVKLVSAAALPAEPLSTATEKPVFAVHAEALSLPAFIVTAKPAKAILSAAFRDSLSASPLPAASSKERSDYLTHRPRDKAYLTSMPLSNQSQRKGNLV